MKATIIPANPSHKPSNKSNISFIQRICFIAADNSIICAFADIMHAIKNFFSRGSALRPVPDIYRT